MRRRNHFMRKRAELFAHIQNTASQYNLQDPLGRIAIPKNRDGVIERFDIPCVQRSIGANLAMIETYDMVIDELERDIIKSAKNHDPVAYALLKTIPGVGKIIALNLLYEIENIKRFPPVCKTSLPIAAWSNVLRNQTAKDMEAPVKRSATLI